MISAGDLAQSIIIPATAVGLKTFETPALKESAIAELLKLQEWHEEALYLVALGR